MEDVKTFIDPPSDVHVCSIGGDSLVTGHSAGE